MEIIRKLKSKIGTVVALGNFDGVHIAHKEIIKSAVLYARENSFNSGVLVFEENTNNAVGRRTEILTTNIQKCDLIKNIGVNFLFLQKFDENFMRKTPEEFVVYLQNSLNARAVSVGYDYRFGYKAQGDIVMLKKLCANYGIDVIVTDKITVGDRVVSSTEVRNFIKNGDVENAAVLLGRYYSIEGKVVSGFQNGRKMGIPTANIAYDEKIILPLAGVYVGVTVVDNKKYRSVVNIGKNLTFGADKITVESHILDFDEDIYGKNVSVEIVKRLRGVKKFNGMNELKNQIAIDRKNAENVNI